jgi:hypothetical protein
VPVTPSIGTIAQCALTCVERAKRPRETERVESFENMVILAGSWIKERKKRLEV